MNTMYWEGVAGVLGDLAHLFLQHRAQSLVHFDAKRIGGRDVWAGVDRTGKTVTNGVPRKTRTLLHKLEVGRRELDAFALHPTNPSGYIFVTHSGVIANGMPPRLVSQLRAFKRRARQPVQAVVLGRPRNGRVPWVFVGGRRTVRSEGVPKTLIAFLRLLLRSPIPAAPLPQIRTIQLFRTHGWAVATEEEIHSYGSGDRFARFAETLKQTKHAAPKFALLDDGRGAEPGYIALAQPGIAAPVNAIQLALRGRASGPGIFTRMRTARTPGCAMAVVLDNRIAWSGGVGLTHRGGAPVDGNTLFAVASISKVIATLAALVLVDQRRLSLSSTAQDVLGDWDLTVPWHAPDSLFWRFDPRVRRIPTIRDLLSHRSGVSSGGYAGLAPGEQIPTLREILDGTTGPKAEIVSHPRRTSAYGGANMTLIEKIVEEVSGQPYRRFVREAVLDPLGMWRSTLSTFSTTTPSGRWARGHDADGRIYPGGRRVYPQAAAAGLWSTANELARIIIMVNQNGIVPGGRRFLQSETAELLKAESSSDHPFSLGFLTGSNDASSGFGYGHGGGQAGARSLMRGGPNMPTGAGITGQAPGGAGFVVLTNAEGPTMRFDVAEDLMRAHHNGRRYHTNSNPS